MREIWEECKGCGKEVPMNEFVWNADSEGFCLRCAEERGEVVRGSDGLLYLKEE